MHRATSQPTPWTLNLPTPHPTPHTPHPTPHTPHPTPHTPHPTPHTPLPTPHTPQPTPHTPHLKPQTPNPTPQTPHPTPPTPHNTTHPNPGNPGFFRPQPTPNRNFGPRTGAREYPQLVLQKVFTWSFCKSRFLHKSVNLSFIISNDKELVDGFERQLTVAKQLDKHFL